MMTHYKYRLEELENMMPWERDIYIIMMNEYLEELKQREENV